MSDVCRVRFTTSSGQEYSFDGLYVAGAGIVSVYQVEGRFESSDVFVHSDPSSPGPYVIVWRRIGPTGSAAPMEQIEEEIWTQVFPGRHHLIEFLEACTSDPSRQQEDQVPYDSLLNQVQAALAELES